MSDEKHPGPGPRNEIRTWGQARAAARIIANEVETLPNGGAGQPYSDLRAASKRLTAEAGGPRESREHPTGFDGKPNKAIPLKGAPPDNQMMWGTERFMVQGAARDVREAAKRVAGSGRSDGDARLAVGATETLAANLVNGIDNANHRDAEFKRESRSTPGPGGPGPADRVPPKIPAPVRGGAVAGGRAAPPAPRPDRAAPTRA